MEPINSFSPRKGEDLKKFSSQDLLLRIILWHQENSRLKLWAKLNDNIQTIEAFQNEWDILCGTLAENLPEELRQKFTISLRKNPGRVTYVFTQPLLREIALSLKFTVNQNLVLAMFPPPSRA